MNADIPAIVAFVESEVFPPVVAAAAAGAGAVVWEVDATALVVTTGLAGMLATPITLFDAGSNNSIMSKSLYDTQLPAVWTNVY